MERRKLAEAQVLGKPCTQGSLTSFTSKSTGKIVTPQNKRLLSWRQEAKHELRQSYLSLRGLKVGLFDGDVELRMSFVYERPKNHFHTSKKRFGELREDAPDRPTQKSYGDLDKLVRAVGDALTGVVLEDDSQIAQFCAHKTFGSPACVLVTVLALDDQDVYHVWPWSGIQ